MRLAIFGATGRTGRVAVTQALEAGHQVTAFVRSPEGLTVRHRDLDTLVMPTLDSEVLRSGLAGVDAVVSTLVGSVRNGSPARTWTAAALGAMEENGVRRVLVTSAAPIGEQGPRKSLPYRIVGWIFRDAHRDLAEMETVVRSSPLDWTVVRPPRLTNGPRTGRYRLAMGENVASGFSVSRADLAEALLRLVDDPDASKQCVGIAY